MEFVTVKGHAIPALGFGTWPMRGSQCVDAVASALDLGYRHIDTAQMYGNEAEVGRALGQSGVDRDTVWLTTKLARGNFRTADVRRSVDASLRSLDCDYVDLLLIHWPDPSVPLGETLDAMAEAQAAGKVRSIGVSNFTVALMTEAVETVGADIVCNQVEYHSRLSQARVLAYARDNDIMVTAYAPLGRGRLDGDRTLAEIGQRHGKSAAQVALRWLIQQANVSAIPKAASRSNQQQNIDIFDFRLTDDEMAAIHAGSGGERVVEPGWAPDWDPQ